MPKASLHILIVDDDPDTLELLSEHIARFGHTVSIAQNGKQALRNFKKGLDVVLCDIIMPEMDGLELIRNTRRTNPNARIVAYTGGSDLMGKDVNLEIAKSLGACMVLSKDELFERLHGVLAELST